MQPIVYAFVKLLILCDTQKWPQQHNAGVGCCTESLHSLSEGRVCKTASASTDRSLAGSAVDDVRYDGL